MDQQLPSHARELGRPSEHALPILRDGKRSSPGDEKTLCDGIEQSEGDEAQLGVNPSKVTETSRGELDAMGTNETSWRNGRRVDLDLE